MKSSKPRISVKQTETTIRIRRTCRVLALRIVAQGNAIIEGEPIAVRFQLTRGNRLRIVAQNDMRQWKT